MTDEQLQRIHDIEYSCDSREELAERIVALEDKLVVYENDHQIATHIHGSWKRLKAEVPKLREENAKLVDVLHEVEEEAVLAYHGLQSDIELLLKSETEFFEKWWHSECRNDNKLKRIEVLDAENAKLRELCTDFAAMLTLAGLEGLMVEATIGGITKTYDASELCDMAENLCDEAS